MNFDNSIMPDLERENRAWRLLQWVPYSLPTEFDEDLALQGYYTSLQMQRSDRALDEWDKAHETQTSPELKAFLELEARGIYSQSIFFSPSKAKDGHYTTRLAKLDNKTISTERSSRLATPYRRTRRRRGLT